MCRWHETYCWKALDEEYNFASDLISIQGLHTKLWAPKVAGVSTLAISRLPLGSPGTKCHLDVGLVERHKKQGIKLWNDHNFKKREDGLGVLKFTLDVGEFVKYDESLQIFWDNLGCKNKRIMTKLNIFYVLVTLRKGISYYALKEDG